MNGAWIAERAVAPFVERAGVQASGAEGTMRRADALVATDDGVSYQSTDVMVCEITGNAQKLRVFLSRSLVWDEYLSPV